jgi:hypothetical protein
MALRAGTENKKQVAIAATMGVILVITLVWFISKTFGTSDTPAAPPAVTTPPAAAGPAAQPASTSTPSGTAKKVGHINLDPTLHTELLAQAESISYTGNGRNIFSQSSAPVNIPKPIVPARPVAAVPSGPPPPPPPPPIDLKFFGYEAPKSGSKRVFLLHGDDIFLASEGDVVNHRYKVVRILPFSIQVEDIPYHNTQNLPLIQN